MRAFLFNAKDLIDATLFKLKFNQWRKKSKEEFMETLQKENFEFNSIYLGIRNLDNIEDLLEDVSIPFIKENLYYTKTNFVGDLIFSPVYGSLSVEDNEIKYLLKVCNSFNRENFIRVLDGVLEEKDLMVENNDQVLSQKELARGFLLGHVTKVKPKDKLLYIGGFNRLLDTKEFLQELKDDGYIKGCIQHSREWYECEGIVDQSLEEFMFKDFVTECLTGLDYDKIVNVCNNEGWTYGIPGSSITSERVAIDFAETISRIISSAYDKIKSLGRFDNHYICLVDQLGRLKTFFNVYKVVDVENYNEYEDDYFIEYNNKRFYFSFSADFIVESFETLMM